jgi:hypothetical protein
MNLKILIITLINILILFFINFTFDQKGQGINVIEGDKYNEIYDNNHKSKIIILGGTSCAYGLSPKHLYSDILSFNLCFENSDPTFIFLLYNSLIRKYYDNKIKIIYALSPGDFNSLNQLRSIDRDALNYKKQSVIQSYFSNKLKIFDVQEISYEVIKNNIYHWNKDEKIGIINSTYNFGFVGINKGVSYLPSMYFNPIFDREKEKVFFKLIENIKNDGTKIEVILMPYPLGAYKMGYIRNYKDVIEKLKTKDYINLINTENFQENYFDNSDFNDINSLKINSAYKFSSLIGSIIGQMSSDESN